MNAPEQNVPADAGQDQPHERPVVGQDALSLTLQSRFQAWLAAREPQELKFLDAYQDAMRIPRDDDTNGTGTSKAQKSRLFVGSTRSKIRSARAKIKDSLFGAGRMPFDTNPTNEQLKSYADTMEAILEFQLKDMGFKGMLGGAVNSLCTYGTGALFGPFERTSEHVTVGLKPDPASGVAVLGENRFEYRAPYFEHGPTMDVYPDPEAPDAQSGMGIFWSSWKQPHEVKGWRNAPGFNAEAIDYATTQLSASSTSEGSDRTTDLRANTYRFNTDGRVRLLRYFGRVDAEALAAWTGEALPEGHDQGDTVEAVVIMAGGVVVKADRSPYKCGHRPAYRCVYEEAEHEFWGVGIAENNDPHQRVVNAAFRLYIEGKAFALLKTFSADRSKFEADEDFKFYPGKRFKFKSGLTPDERKTAIIWHDVADVTQGWEHVIAMSEKFSDDDTGVTKYTQGTDADHLNKTATGISMIMNASSLPMKEVIQNIDEMWIEPVIEGLVDWNMQHLEPQTVAVLLGDDHAKRWAEIQQFGKTSFMAWKATGSSTFMTKEILMQKLQGFLQLCLASPLTADKVDVRELLEQVWNAGEVGRESPVYDDETLKQKQAQQGGQIPPQIQDTLAKQEALIQQLEAKLQDRTEKQAADAARAEVQDRNSRVDAEAKLAQVELTEANIALVQAQVIATLRAAGIAIPPGMAAAAQVLEVEPDADERAAMQPDAPPAPAVAPAPAPAPVSLPAPPQPDPTAAPSTPGPQMAPPGPVDAAPMSSTPPAPGAVPVHP